MTHVVHPRGSLHERTVRPAADPGDRTTGGISGIERDVTYPRPMGDASLRRMSRATAAFGLVGFVVGRALLLVHA